MTEGEKTAVLRALRAADEALRSVPEVLLSRETQRLWMCRKLIERTALDVDAAITTNDH